ncbi:glycosyltransferase [Bhargavaea ginsengi]|uniref:glycosyltransferase n=1 Tax=Bhargavaea ginsengi TaxID=426757 RepID=UPI00203A8839|nr:glycosyltransferase [Bhargavaea ginsengi]MCM3088666.1 glycosyltransferase [Bhargavaea ginsengi]
MKNVLIISYSFPPLNNIASRRFGEMCEYLTMFGWDPYILTTKSNGPLETIVEEDKIIRIGEHPQKNSEIKKDDYNKKHSIKSSILNLKRSLGFNSRLLDRSYIQWNKRVQKEIDIHILKDIRFDVIIASFGPGSALFIGRYLSKELNIPLIADFRDLAALFNERHFNKNLLMKKIDFVLEKKILKSAAAITTVSNGLKEQFDMHYSLPVEVIYNGWEHPTGSIEINNNCDKRYVYYAGRFYPHQLESMYLLLRELKGKNIKLKIRSLGPESLNKEIISVAKNIGIEDFIELLPPAAPEIIVNEAENAFINIVIEDLDKTIAWKKGTLTGKFLTLLIRKPPIMAIARNDSEIGEILRETGKGMLCSTSEEVNWFLKNIEKFHLNMDKERIKYYAKQNQAKKLSEVMNSVVDNVR